MNEKKSSANTNKSLGNQLEKFIFIQILNSLNKKIYVSSF